MSGPSNAALMEAIGELRGEIKADLRSIRADVVAVREQATKTNGRITRLEQKQIEADAVDRYKKEQPVIAHADVVSVKPGIWDNPKTAGLITALVTLLLAVAGYLTYLSGGVHR